MGAPSSTGPILLDGYSTAKDENGYTGTPVVNTVQSVGNFSAFYESAILTELKANTDDNSIKSAITEVGATGRSGIYLTGFKLESMIVSASQQIDSSKVVPLVNGDSITLTNICKAGTLAFNASRTAAGFAGGDCVTVFDYVRSQGDIGGRLVLKWLMNGATHTLIFTGVCIKNIPAVAIAGNDVPDYNTQLTYSGYTDSDSPAFNPALS